MRSLQRLLWERKTRRFVDQMIHNYGDIRLAATKARTRPRAEGSGVRKPPVNGDPHRGEGSDLAAERSTSSGCRPESDRSSRLSSTLLDGERSQSAKGLADPQQHEEARLDRWRMSEAPTVSEYGSAISSTRLTRLLEEEDDEYENQDNQENTMGSPRDSVSTTEVEESQEHSCSLSECEASSANLESEPPASTQSSVGNQIEDRSQLSECSTESPPTSSITETLPRLRPTTPAHCVVPNCCDFFTSPHPHFRKEVIGMAQKVEEPLNDDPSQLNSASPGATSEAADNERGNQSGGRSDEHRSNTSSRAGRENDEFEMWDYVCPQYARPGYANEWV
ncbi:hypothetical protein PHYPSEUDO_009487 [Phytophthora pseudosyringae]|uniref:Uncharacterized protein n=1 Tax=Phytophthora pseudosyringae TaxID=221518 RepID=A0A8T1VEX9_9STRA|nr:hypothetical protein PHYPSEUDO_009487 [Phytophthora pseudosyringae]